MSNQRFIAASDGLNDPARAPRYWRSLAELEGDTEFLKRLKDEFVPDASVLLDPTSRRNFLRLMGASLALAGLAGCSDFPSEKIIPYVNQPESVLPGTPSFYATSIPFCGYAMGALAVSHEGRPTKIEGNPDHPASLGSTSVFMQASVLDLYDPDRSSLVTHAGIATSWGAFYEALGRRLDPVRGKGDGLRLLTRTITSPTLAAQLKEFRRQFPDARWHVHDPTAMAGCSARNGGAPGHAVYDFSKADVILSLDGDFLFSDVGSLAYTRQFADGRRRKPGTEASQQGMNRLYVVESTFSLTGSMADHRAAVKPDRVMDVARAVAALLGVGSDQSAAPPPGLEHFVEALAEDLKRPLDMGASPANGGVGLVVAGDSQPPALQALAYEMNLALGSIGKAVRYVDPVPVQEAETLESLVADMAAGKVDTLLVLGGNPAYDAPADVPFAQELRRMTTALDAAGKPARFTAHLGMYEDETAFECQWHVPESHYLEAWGDVRAYDGTASIIQPLIVPLKPASRSLWEFMQAVLGEPDRSGYEAVRALWQSRWASAHGNAVPTSGPASRPAILKRAASQREAADFDEWWDLVLQKGVINNSAAPALDVSGRQSAPGQGAIPASGAGEWDLVFRPDMTTWDGQYANNPWLQELPKPFTKLVWDNAALISYRSAEKLGLTDGSVIRITCAGRTLPDVPVVIVPGVPDQTLTLSLGYGRTRGGRVARESDGIVRGFNAYALRSARSPGFGVGADVALVPGVSRQLVMTRSHHAMADLPGLKLPTEQGPLKPNAIEHPGMDEQELEVGNRKLVRAATLADFRADPDWATKLGGDVEMREKGISPQFPGRKIHLSLYPDGAHGGWDYSKGYQWAMSIDQTACIGCNACVIACQAENNIPVVGKDQCSREREMHWIRIDDWFGSQPEAGGSNADALDDPQVVHVPVACQHCENAPCEVVCPVGATTHSVEGLNEMTYNRCIGTRYCSNNCPYKVRRFNFLLYSDYTTPTRALQYNPDVTVRSRGVMEKCSYCVQRLNRTRMEIEKMTLGLEERAGGLQGDSPQDAAAMRAQLPEQQKAMLAQLQTACQQACPARAIVFGNRNDPDSPIARLKEDKLDYTMLSDLTTQPRTSYLARLKNANPKLAKVS